jgi:predicted dienelactone hydrolase
MPPIVPSSSVGWSSVPASPARFGALVLLALAAACSNASPRPASSTAPPTAAASSTAAREEAATTTAPATTAPAPAAPAQAYARPGPHPVGTIELMLGDWPVTVWYPAVAGSQTGRPKATYDLRAYLPAAEQAKVASTTSAVFTTDAFANLPAAPGSVPLVLFSHGLGGYRQQSSFLTTALASWGFVVAAPEHRSRDLTAVLEGRLAAGPSDVDDLRQTIALLIAENARAGGPLQGRVDATRVALVGHSAGGGAAFQLADDPSAGVDAVVGLAPAISAERPGLRHPVPSLTVAGTADVVIPPSRVDAAWQAIAGPKRLVTLGGVTHLGFMDTCLQSGGDGGVLAEAERAGVAVPELVVRLFADGCDRKYTPAVDAHPVIVHTTVAELRVAFGIDREPVGLDASLAGSYPAVPVTYRQG